MSSNVAGPKAFIIRREGFSAAHRMYNTKWDEETNKQIFGPCYQLHGHNYQLEVALYGPIDAETGMVFDIAKLKKIMKDHVLDLMDHKQIDVLPFFQERPSTAENISVFIWHQLKDQIPNGLLYEVKLFETDKNSVIYRGEGIDSIIQ
eukprot:TRINITY_DN5763_c0_g1_i1.p2 TRINITY_DN5763_c0_g1~~TRINITY_DN5763_c0_g1_i1.p2  ORF type:complete len:148 (+),score=40.11 TRINITY_DN5763_c0_g1_i1:50-493(+)